MAEYTRVRLTTGIYLVRTLDDCNNTGLVANLLGTFSTGFMGRKARRESTPHDERRCSLFPPSPNCRAVLCSAVPCCCFCCAVSSVLCRFFCMFSIGRVLWAKKGSVQEETARLAAEVCAAGSPPSEVKNDYQTSHITTTSRSSVTALNSRDNYCNCVRIYPRQQAAWAHG